jgi:hypothetical protein
MPTVRSAPRKQTYPHFHKLLPRMVMEEKMKSSVILSFLLFLKKNASRSIFYLRILSLMCAHVLHEEIYLKKSSTIYPFDPTRPRLNFFSACWYQNSRAENTFIFRYRFSRQQFAEVMRQFDFLDVNSNVKDLMYGKKGHTNLCRLDTALMIVLRRLAYPNRRGDLVDEFNMPSNSINDVFNSMIDFLFLKYALPLSDPAIWSDMFPDFCPRLARNGSSLSKPSRYNRWQFCGYLSSRWFG